MPKRRFFRFFICILAFGSCMGTKINAQETVKIGGRRIVGGEPARIEDHPWQVAFNIEKPDGEYLCGGAIIAERWVLSAKHCFAEPAIGTGAARVKSGATNIIKDGAWSDVERIVLHEDHDLALVKLKETAKGRIIPLAPDSTTLNAGQPVEVTGWGLTEYNKISDVLRKATVPYVDNATCNSPDSYRGSIKSYMICAGHRDGGVDSCQGDSGGPLVLYSANGPVLVGIVSWGEGCALKLKYGVYVRVVSHRAWINQVISADVR